MKWEYIVREEWKEGRGGERDSQGQLNLFGDKGWGLISVYTPPKDGKTIYYFKRPKTD
jgi:hypothetical protein